MDSKVPLEEPPPYTAFPPNVDNLDELQLNSLTSYLQHHVISLPDRIRAIQQARRTEQSFKDASLLDRIVPIVENFLADVGARHKPVPLATLTLVPAVAVPKNAVLSGLEDMKRRGELCRVARITMDSASKDSKSSSGGTRSQYTSEDPSWAPGKEFDDWGRFGANSSICDNSKTNETLWWRDEEMAHRLASYLQPKKEKKTPVEHNSVVQTVVEQRIPPKKEKRGWSWGKRGSAPTSPNVPTMLAESSIREDELQEDQGKPGAEMVVTAQEVAFRHENELGIWESTSGWGIVLTVKIGT
ncbi:hypothetical protein F4819DRAFT_113124 [Hypoxylon fuscum]|nr:hypothetical protein F4819DRAFT_113124 [Hypoxylon fuscum]